MSQALCESVSQALSACSIRSFAAPFATAIHGTPLIALSFGTAAAMAPERAQNINAAGLVLLSLVMLVSTVASMAITAYRGELMKGVWHEVWTPIVVSLSTGLIAPVTGGKSLAQMAVEAVIGAV